MYPTLLRIGNFEITSFGLMMFVAFITGGWVLTRQYRRYGLSEDLASTVLMVAAIGGIAGAKIYYAILFRDWHLLLDRAGLVWYGGLLGGWLAVSLLLWRKRVDYFTAADGIAPALAIGYCLGRHRLPEGLTANDSRGSPAVRRAHRSVHPARSGASRPSDAAL